MTSDREEIERLTKDLELGGDDCHALAALIRRLEKERDEALKALREAYALMSPYETPVVLQLRIEAILALSLKEPT